MRFEDITPDQIPEGSPVDAFRQLWAQKKQPNGAIARSDMRPETIPKLMPWVLILEHAVLDGRATFKCRFCGTKVRDLLGFNATGRTLEDMQDPDAIEPRMKEYTSVLESGEPSFKVADLPIKGREFMAIFRGVFPASSDGTHADQIVLVTTDSFTAKA